MDEPGGDSSTRAALGEALPGVLDGRAKRHRQAPAALRAALEKLL